jgi:hypothetical protein
MDGLRIVRRGRGIIEGRGRWVERCERRIHVAWTEIVAGTAVMSARPVVPPFWLPPAPPVMLPPIVSTPFITSSTAVIPGIGDGRGSTESGRDPSSGQEKSSDEETVTERAAHEGSSCDKLDAFYNDELAIIFRFGGV